MMKNSDQDLSDAIQIFVENEHTIIRLMREENYWDLVKFIFDEKLKIDHKKHWYNMLMVG